MKHLFIDKYSNLNSPIHRINPRIKFIFGVGFILLAIFIPLDYFIFLLPLLLILVLLSHVPLIYFIQRSLVILPFALLVAISGNWDKLLRGYVSILTVILLSSTTRFPDLLKAFQGIGCPRLIIMVMAFMYRYIYVLIDELMRMKRAHDSRILKHNRWVEIKTLTNLIGVLFVRSYERAERVYIAMCSRGFTGEIK